MNVRYNFSIFFGSKYILFVAFLFILIKCKNKEEVNPEMNSSDEEQLTAAHPLLNLLSPDVTGIDFANFIQEDLENNILTNINMYNGGGLCIADINNDQLPDIYFVCSNGKNRLYLNVGNLKFKDITDQSQVGSKEGFETAVTAADVNGDGWLDFYICRAGVKKNAERQNKLYINNKDLTFTERSKEYGVDDMSASTGAALFDYDLDGDLDLYLLNYPTDSIWTNKVEARLNAQGKYVPQLHPRSEFDSDRFYRNDINTDGKFKDISQDAGVWNLGYGLSVTISDINRDGWPDVYVGNDFIQPDRLYINNQKGGFVDELDKYFKHTSQHTMGTDLSDFDNDGLVDLFAVDMLANSNYRQKTLLATNSQTKYSALTQNGYFEPVVRNVLQHNNGNGTFSDVACISGLYKTDWSWSGLLFDINNDGLRDVYVTNGFKRDITNRDFIEFKLAEVQKVNADKRNLQDVYKNFEEFQNILPSSSKIRDFCFQNKGDFFFEDVSGTWLTSPATWSCGAAWTDLDADGDLDLVVNNLESPAFIYQNLSSDQKINNFLQVSLQGLGLNPFGVGASVSVEYGAGKKQYAELYPTRGIFSSVEYLIHFGIGQVDRIDLLEVRWPNGHTQQLTNIEANQKIILYEKDAKEVKTNMLFDSKIKTNPYFSEQKNILFTHEENDFNDFESWPLNPWKESESGPYLAAGDVNGDRLDDLFIGNGFDKAPKLLIQKSNGLFTPSSEATWNQTKIYEDHGACFFDADMDGDLDLFVVSGGPEATSAAAWQNRLYINVDGKGSFIYAGKAIPQTPDVGGRVCSFDYDQDGDNDIFIGGRILPGRWPFIPKSVILRNERTHFTNVTAEVSPEFDSCGMVTDLQWINIDNDMNPELVVCGEWMPISVFKIVKNKLLNITSALGLDSTNGIWNKLAYGDLDNDGDIDLVTGNMGLNTRFTASISNPLRCFADDFDKNNTIDPILAYYEENKLYPLVQKDVLLKQIPSLKKKFLYADDYGKATIYDIYPKEILDQALNLFCYELSSCWWENKQGHFVKHILPRSAQLSTCQGILIADFNGDHHPDILLAGNKHGMEVETNPCDAGNGALLIGDGKGEFKFIENRITGFWAQGEVRDMSLLKSTGNKKIIVVGNNNSGTQTYSTNNNTK